MPLWYTVLLMVVAFLAGWWVRSTRENAYGVPLIVGEGPEVQPGSIFDGSQVQYGDLDRELTAAEQDGTLPAHFSTPGPDLVDDLVAASRILVDSGPGFTVPYHPDKVWVVQRSYAPTDNGPWSEPEIVRRVMLGTFLFKVDEWSRPWNHEPGLWVRARETAISRVEFDAWVQADIERRHRPNAAPAT